MTAIDQNQTLFLALDRFINGQSLTKYQRKLISTMLNSAERLPALYQKELKLHNNATLGDAVKTIMRIR